jgi:hypothetical protein
MVGAAGRGGADRARPSDREVARRFRVTRMSVNQPVVAALAARVRPTLASTGRATPGESSLWRSGASWRLTPAAWAGRTCAQDS